jgi:DNA-binding GntR family transcriptional regulator
MFNSLSKSIMDDLKPPPTAQDDESALIGEELRARIGRANEIRAALQDEIESGQLPPAGASLDERALAARFLVSRTPVREALQQLAARDLVRIAPRPGVTVAKVSINTIRGMMETLGELEALSAKTVARRVDDKLRRSLDDALSRCQDAAIQGGSAEYAVANTWFHEVDYNSSRNSYLSDLLTRVESRTWVSYMNPPPNSRPGAATNDCS